MSTLQETTNRPSLQERLSAMSPEAIVKMGRELSAALSKEPESCHGGIWPGNIFFDDDGKAYLGPRCDKSVSELSADQVEYLAPEVFWNDQRSPAADSYSLALVMYTALQKGRLPFLDGGEEDELARATALRRRMKGEELPAPQGVSEELAAVLSRSLSQEPAARYAAPGELLQALGETHEALPSEAPETEPGDFDHLPEAPEEAPTAGILSDEMVDSYTVRAQQEQAKAAAAPKARSHSRKKKKGPSSGTVILIVGVLMVLALIGVAVAALGNLGGQDTPPVLSATLTPAPTAEPTPEPTPEPTAEPSPTPNPVVFTAFPTEDDWNTLTAAALDGGAGLRLAPITTQAQMDAAITAAEAKGLKNLWLGAEYLEEDEAPNGQAGWYWTDGTPLADDDPCWADGQPGEDPAGKKLMLCYVPELAQETETGDEAPAESGEDAAAESESAAEADTEAEDTAEPEADADAIQPGAWRFFAVDPADTDEYEDLGYLLTGRVTATPAPKPSPTVTPSSSTSQPKVTPNYDSSDRYVPTAQPTAKPTTAPTAQPTVAPTATATPTAPTTPPSNPPSNPPTTTAQPDSTTYSVRTTAWSSLTDDQKKQLACATTGDVLDVIVATIEAYNADTANTDVTAVWLGATYDSTKGGWYWSNGTQLLGTDEHWASAEEAAKTPGQLMLKYDSTSGSWKYYAADPTTTTETVGTVLDTTISTSGGTGTGGTGGGTDDNDDNNNTDDSSSASYILTALPDSDTNWTTLTTGTTAVSLAVTKDKPSLDTLIEELNDYNADSSNTALDAVWLGAEYRAADTTNNTAAGWYWLEGETATLFDSTVTWPWKSGQTDAEGQKLMLRYQPGEGDEAGIWVLSGEAATYTPATGETIGYAVAAATPSAVSGDNSSDGLALTGLTDDGFDESLLIPVGGK